MCGFRIFVRVFDRGGREVRRVGRCEYHHFHFGSYTDVENPISLEHFYAIARFKLINLYCRYSVIQ